MSCDGCIRRLIGASILWKVAPVASVGVMPIAAGKPIPKTDCVAELIAISISQTRTVVAADVLISNVAAAACAVLGSDGY